MTILDSQARNIQRLSELDLRKLLEQIAAIVMAGDSCADDCENKCIEICEALEGQEVQS